MTIAVNKILSSRPWVLYMIGSILFLLLPIFSSPDFSWDFHFFSVPPFQRSLISYFILLLFFYFQLFFLLPQYFFKNRFWVYWLFFIVALIIYSFLPSLLIPRHHFLFNDFSISKRFSPPPPPPQHSRNQFFFLFFQHFFQFVMVAIFAYAIRIYARWKKAEQAIVEAELAYLKAQINPHFLFNTLNSIYSLAIQKSDATADAVAQLSSMMRYVLADAAQHFVPLSKEIEYLSDYIALQSTRLSDNVVFEFNIEGEPKQQQIAPMLLIPLIENAFKYGASPDEECFISILIIIKDNQFVFSAKNKKINMRIDKTNSNKLGIENVRKRLQRYYPSNSDLTINEDDNMFLIVLKISFA